MNTSSRNVDLGLKITQAAAQLFARQGYRGTSTREIARVAEVSENTLFRHFEHKEDIFWAVLHNYLSGLKMRRDLLDSIGDGEEPGVVLPQVLAHLMDTVTLKPELLRLLAVGLIELKWKTEAVCYQYLSPIFTTLNRYLEQNMDDGKIRNLNPSMVTAALTVMAMLHPEFLKLISGATPPYSDNREAIQAYTSFWLGILTSAEV